MKNPSSPFLSPKVGKTDDERQQYLMKKRSPNKPFDDKELGLNTSVKFQR